jgi:tetratricopeptide (TPR) repeat protein
MGDDSRAFEPADADPLRVLGATLRRLRVSHGLSLRALARQVGMTAHSGLVDYELGRRLPPADLVTAYQRVFPHTAGELGRLRETALARRATGPGSAAAGETTVVTVPFPADFPDLAGRETEIAQLESWLDTVSDRQAPVVLAVSGPPGVGKTSLAVHLAHRLAPRYPDALLHLDLHGTAGTPTDAGVALTRLLRGVGLPDGEIPDEPEDRAARLRAQLYRRRALLLLDDAAHEAQIRPLLPSGAATLTLITSRNPLAGLETARQLALDALSPEAAIQLLAAVIGPARVDAEPADARRLVAHCGLLPLATRIAASRLATWPRSRLAECADQLADTRRRLDWLRSGDREVRGAFALSYRMLPEPGRQLLRRLALVPGPDFGAEAAGAVVDEPPPAAERLLHALASVGLVQPAVASGRYRFHDLIALFAHELLKSEETAADRETARRRLTTWALRTAERTSRLLDPSGFTKPDPGGPLQTAGAAIRWFDAESAVVLDAIRCATADDRADLVLPLLDNLPWYFDLRLRWADARELAEHALTLARRHEDRLGQAAALTCLSLALRELGHTAEAIEPCEQAYQLAEGDQLLQGVAMERWGMALIRLDRPAEAISRFEQAITILRRQPYRWFEAGALNHLGYALRTLSRHEEALAAHKQAGEIFHAIDAVRGEGMACAAIGYTLLGAERWHEAVTQFEIALEHFCRGHDDWGQGYARHGLGRARWALGDHPGATAALRQATRLFGEQNDPHHQAESLRMLARLEAAAITTPDRTRSTETRRRNGVGARGERR